MCNAGKVPEPVLRCYAQCDLNKRFCLDDCLNSLQAKIKAGVKASISIPENDACLKKCGEQIYACQEECEK